MDKITDIEYTKFDGKEYCFTCSLDRTVKAWTEAPDKRSLVLVAEFFLDAKATSMQIATPTFLLVGLDNGSLAGWNLVTNKIDKLAAHSGANSAISHIEKNTTLLYTGDNAGRVQIRNTTNYQLLIPEF